MIVNPLAFKILKMSKPNEATNKGAQSSSRFEMLFCSMCSISASMSRAERIAVSPEVIGAAMTPSTARIPPKIKVHNVIANNIPKGKSQRIKATKEKLPLSIIFPSYFFKSEAIASRLLPLIMRLSFSLLMIII